MSRRTMYLIAAGVLLFLLFFHVVPNYFLIFPKGHASFADTFVDVDEYIERYNAADPRSQRAMEASHLHRELESHGLIKRRNLLDY